MRDELKTEIDRKIILKLWSLVENLQMFWCEIAKIIENNIDFLNFPRYIWRIPCKSQSQIVQNLKQNFCEISNEINFNDVFRL
jgi:hypothetical protein